jgi:hypothetical protein
MAKIQMTKTRRWRTSLRRFIEALFLASKGVVLNFEQSDFGFVSGFGFRASDFF